MNNSEQSQYAAIAELAGRLRAAGVTGVEVYEGKLRSNACNLTKLEDLWSEARVAMLFRRHGWGAELRERPDLQLHYRGEELYAEVKHFHEKRQDHLDNENMQRTTTMVQIGDTIPSEGVEADQQIANVAIAKARAGQFQEGAKNLLVVYSSSDCLDMMCRDAIHRYDEEFVRSRDSRLRFLSAIMLISPSISGFNSPRGPCNVKSEMTSFPFVALGETLFRALDEIRLSE